MTTTQDKPRRTVDVTVAGHEIHNGKPTTKLEIPAWESRYPITLYGTTPEQQALLPMGTTLRVVLQADRLMDGKDNSKPYNFFWSFVRVATADDEAPSAPPQGGSTPASAAPTQGTMQQRDPTRQSIERQTALKAAVEYYGAYTDGMQLATPGMVVDTAQVFFGWLSEEMQS